MVTCRPCSVKHRLSSVLCGRCLPLQQQGAHSAGLTWRVLALEFGAYMAPSPVSTHGRSCLISMSTEILKGLKRDYNRTADVKTMAREELQHKWTAPGPKFTGTPPEVRDWPGGEPAPSAYAAGPYWGLESSACRGLWFPLPGPLNG